MRSGIRTDAWLALSFYFSFPFGHNDFPINICIFGKGKRPPGSQRVKHLQPGLLSPSSLRNPRKANFCRMMCDSRAWTSVMEMQMPRGRGFHFNLQGRQVSWGSTFRYRAFLMFSTHISFRKKQVSSLLGFNR